jgi:ornithine carbamoyltransferase
MEKIKSTGNPKVIFMHCLPATHDGNTEIGKMVYQRIWPQRNGSNRRSI